MRVATEMTVPVMRRRTTDPEVRPPLSYHPRTAIADAGAPAKGEWDER